MDRLTLGSLFDGIGVWQLAAVNNGIIPIWSSEIDDYPMSVTAYHFPETIWLGDVTKVDGKKITPVDIVCAGSPCQDLSVAGKRAGLDGERSGLFSEAIRIIREMRESTNGEHPKWFVWENVTGAYSSNNGNDFRVVLEEITENKIPIPDSGRWARGGLVRSPKCDVAWRTLDAQYWGVPQRRARIFLVADFREERRPEVLFEQESLPWNPTQSREQGENTSRDTRESPKSTSGTICIEGNGTRASHNGDGYKESDVMYTLNTVEQHAVCSDTKGYNISSYNSNSMKSNNPHNGIKACEQSRTIDTNGNNPACNQGGTVLVKCIGNGQVNQLGLSDKVGALNCMHEQQGVIYALDRASFNQGKNAKYDFKIEEDKCSTLVARGPSAVLVKD